MARVSDSETSVVLVEGGQRVRVRGLGSRPLNLDDATLLAAQLTAAVDAARLTTLATRHQDHGDVA